MLATGPGTAMRHQLFGEERVSSESLQKTHRSTSWSTA